MINIGTEVDSAAIQFIRELLQNNVAGIPLVHKTEIFDFDPDVSIKRREQFYEVSYLWFSSACKSSLLTI